MSQSFLVLFSIKDYFLSLALQGHNMHGIANLLVSAIAFVGSHFALSHPLRPALTARLGETRFTILYSIVAAITITWFVLAAIAAPAAPLWWIAAPGIWDLATLVMLLAAILLAGSLVGNPALVDPTLRPNIPAAPRGVLAITRQPDDVGVFALGHRARRIMGQRVQPDHLSRHLHPRLLRRPRAGRQKGAAARAGMAGLAGENLLLAFRRAIYRPRPMGRRNAAFHHSDCRHSHLAHRHRCASMGRRPGRRPLALDRPSLMRPGMITPDAFRQLALAVPGAVEQSHMGHPDFRIGKRIFASLGYPNAGCAVLKLTLDQREMLVAAEPAMFSPVPGGWGQNGATILTLAHADETTARSALAMAAANLIRRKA